MDTEAIILRPESPAPGATGVPVSPIFQWTAVVGAEAYELLVATSTDMSRPIIVRMGEDAITGNAWHCNVSLDYATTYYWKVRAINASTSSAWSTTGVFTTENAPEATPAPVPDGTVAEILPLANNPTPVLSVPAATITPSVSGLAIPDLNEAPDGLPDVPEWVIYLIGGLLGTVILALSIVLAIVIKIKRIL